jgi:hypothetical protein
MSGTSSVAQTIRLPPTTPIFHVFPNLPTEVQRLIIAYAVANEQPSVKIKVNFDFGDDYPHKRLNPTGVVLEDDVTLPRLAPVSHFFYNEIQWLIQHSSIIPQMPVFKEGAGARAQEMVPFNPRTLALTLRSEDRDMDFRDIYACYNQLSSQLQESIRHLNIECKTEDGAQWLVSMQMMYDRLGCLVTSIERPCLERVTVSLEGGGAPWLEGTLNRDFGVSDLQWVERKR